MALGQSYHEVAELTRQLDSLVEAGEVQRRAVALFEALSREGPADRAPRRAWRGASARSQSSSRESAGTMRHWRRSDDRGTCFKRSPRPIRPTAPFASSGPVPR